MDHYGWQIDAILSRRYYLVCSSPPYPPDKGVARPLAIFVALPHPQSRTDRHVVPASSIYCTPPTRAERCFPRYILYRRHRQQHQMERSIRFAHPFCTDNMGRCQWMLQQDLVSASTSLNGRWTNIIAPVISTVGQGGTEDGYSFEIPFTGKHIVSWQDHYKKPQWSHRWR